MVPESKSSPLAASTTNASRCERSLHLRADVRGCRVQTRGPVGQLAFAGADAKSALHRMEEALVLSVSVSHRELDEHLRQLEA